MFWRGVVEELLWFISGSTNAKVMVSIFYEIFALLTVLSSVNTPATLQMSHYLLCVKGKRKRLLFNWKEYPCKWPTSSCSILSDVESKHI